MRVKDMVKKVDKKKYTFAYSGEVMMIANVNADKLPDRDIKVKVDTRKE